MTRFLRRTLVVSAVLFVALGAEALPARAQHDTHAGHAAMASKPSTDSAPRLRVATLPGQDAFGAIAEIVKILKADPATDWSKVNLEALRQHLIDMNEVTLRSLVASEPVPGGLRLTVTGTGRTRDAIQRMVGAHGHVLMTQGLQGSVEPIGTGVRWTVTTPDTARVAELRGLGFIGIMALGDHHTTHHLQLARGDTPDGHGT